MAEPLPGTGEDEVFAPPHRALAPLTGQGGALTAVAAGGALGGLARYGAGVALPHGPATFPLATFGVNVLGCLLIGALIVLLTEARRAHRLLRPFLVTGILGGFTTFSTYATDAQELLGAGRVGLAGAYLAGTLVAAVAATWSGIQITRALIPSSR